MVSSPKLLKHYPPYFDVNSRHSLFLTFSNVACKVKVQEIAANNQTYIVCFQKRVNL